MDNIHNEIPPLRVTIPIDVAKRWPVKPTDEDVEIITKAVNKAILEGFYYHMMNLAKEARDE